MRFDAISEKVHSSNYSEKNYSIAYSAIIIIIVGLIVVLP